MLDVSVALVRLLEHFSPVGTETIRLEKGYHRVLAKDIIADSDLPSFDNSSMDGYAVRCEDILDASRDSPVSLKVVDDIPAGKTPSKVIGSMEAARIMTGALIPPGANAVVPVELTDRSDDTVHGAVPGVVRIFSPVEEGAFIRRAASYFTRGSLVINAGTTLRPQDIGLLAMLGKPEIQVFRKPLVGLISSGDELIPVDQPRIAGKIHDSNAYMLIGLIERDGGSTIYQGIIPDNEDAILSAMDELLSHDVDLIVSTAGVSVGAFDLVKIVVERKGELDFWRVNMRPGKPLAFGQFMGTPFIGLPGNPVSAFVGYEVFVRPALLKLAGRRDLTRRKIRVIVDQPLESDGRESYLRAVVHYVSREWHAALTGGQESGNLFSLVQANALLIMPSGVKSLPSGAEVDAWILDDSAL